MEHRYASIDLHGGRLHNVGTLTPSVLTVTNGTVVLDFAQEVDNVQAVNISLLTTFTTTNLQAGRTKEVLITGLIVTTLSFPSSWIWYGSKLTATLLSKEIRLRLRAMGTTDATVRAEFVAQV